MFRIEWEKKALKQFSKLPLNDRKSINESVKKLSKWPECQNVKALSNHDYQYRLRVGRYRIFFDIENVLKILRIEEVKKRDERTY
jgi:mRNA-degrading endonuclease RelE of RelBE toxin-antitoxin system